MGSSGGLQLSFGRRLRERYNENLWIAHLSTGATYLPS